LSSTCLDFVFFSIGAVVVFIDVDAGADDDVDGGNDDVDGPVEVVCNNYFSLGIDSKVTLEFDRKRKNHPELFTARWVNQGWYIGLGLKSFIQEFRAIRKYVILIADGKEKRIPKRVKSLVVTNIPSYAAGTNPWYKAPNSKKVPEVTPQSIDDGYVEVFGFNNVNDLGSERVGFGKMGLRICQAKLVKLLIIEPIAGQVDGEPYLFDPCRITISFFGKSKMLFNSAKDKNQKQLLKLIGQYYMENEHGEKVRMSM